MLLFKNGFSVSTQENTFSSLKARYYYCHKMPTVVLCSLLYLNVNIQHHHQQQQQLQQQHQEYKHGFRVCAFN